MLSANIKYIAGDHTPLPFVFRTSAAGNNNCGGGGKPGLEAESLEKHRAPISPRQVHPVCEEKLQLAYDEEPPPPPAYPLTPNLIMEGGRIQFKPPPPDHEYDAPPPDVAPSPTEKCDPVKESLEARVLELEAALEAERKACQKERQLTAKLQRQQSRREVLQRDVDRERRLRLDSECRLRTSLSEAERCHSRLAALQRELTRMEETLRPLLQYKARHDQLRQDKNLLTAAYEGRLQQLQTTLSRLSQEHESLKKQLHVLEAAGAGEAQVALVERLRDLEGENSSLTREGESQRKQYERCLDDVASQVVRALLAQKGLREEIETLQQRVRDLETQNRTLTSVLLQQLTSVAGSTDTPRPKPAIKFALPAPGKVAGTCEDVRLRVWEDSLVWLPVQRPSSLSLENCCPYRHRTQVPQLGRKEEEEGSESPESGNRDEGYSTMSSDVQGLAEPPRRGLEELKEASDETDAALPVTSTSDRLVQSEVVVMVSVSGTNRHSFPPVRELVPWQHVVRSWSDSHLCLRLGSPLRHLADDDSSSWCSGDWWDSDCVQQWLRLDDSRSALQQQLEYDAAAAELEDWSMEEDMWRHTHLAHSQTLPSIQEAMATELDDDSNECLWNSSNYLPGEGNVPERNLWFNNRLISPGGDSWSSAGTNSEDGRSVNDCGKRSSTAMSSDSGESPAVGTDFTRDFYRLVKFESTKSLASTSSRGQNDSSNLKKSEIPVTTPLSSDREETLQSVLHFIAEQQHYVLSQEVMDTSRDETSPSCEDEMSKDTVKEIVQICKEVKRLSLVEVEDQNNAAEKRPLSCDSVHIENSSSSIKSRESHKSTQTNSSESTAVVVDSLDSLRSGSDPVPNGLPIDQESKINVDVPLNTPKILQEEEDCDSYLKIEREKRKTERLSHEHVEQSVSLGRTASRPGLKPVPEEDEEHHTVSNSSAPVTLTVHKTSKDMIEELNRMIRKGEEAAGEAESNNTSPHLDTSYPTGWVRVHRDLDFTDPKMRANLLDVMLAAGHSSSSSADSSTCSSDGEEPQDYQHLHRLHRFRRHKKASATREPLGALRCSASVPRPSIIGREDFYVRFGDKEREAVASFDFLEELSTTSVSGASSCDQVAQSGGRGSDSSPSPSPDRPLSLSDSCAASYSDSDRLSAN